MQGADVEIVETSGTGSGLSVPGKSGEDIVVSTGDRIRVPVKLSGGGAEMRVYMNGALMDQATQSISKYKIPDEGNNNNIGPGILVKWTLSDVRTTGVIAKGEFVVPEVDRF